MLLQKIISTKGPYVHKLNLLYTLYEPFMSNCQLRDFIICLPYTCATLKHRLPTQISKFGNFRFNMKICSPSLFQGMVTQLLIVIFLLVYFSNFNLAFNNAKSNRPNLFEKLIIQFNIIKSLSLRYKNHYVTLTCNISS